MTHFPVWVLILQVLICIPLSRRSQIREASLMQPKRCKASSDVMEYPLSSQSAIMLHCVMAFSLLSFMFAIFISYDTSHIVPSFSAKPSIGCTCRNIHLQTLRGRDCCPTRKMSYHKCSKPSFRLVLRLYSFSS